MRSTNYEGCSPRPANPALGYDKIRVDSDRERRHCALTFSTGQRVLKALQNKVAIVTGASSGIGSATARLFAQEGAKLVMAGRRIAALDALADEIRRSGGEALTIAGDLRNERAASELVDAALQGFGRLDLAVNNAGTLGAAGATTSLAREAWEETVATNLTAAFLCAKHEIPALIASGGGALVFVSTFVGYTVGFPGLAAYAASKTGLVGLTRALAVEYAAEGIRVNALLPGGTATPMARRFASTPEAMRAVADLHALGRIAAPEEIARSALYLASEASSFTTGSILLADGGLSIFRV